MPRRGAAATAAVRAARRGIFFAGCAALARFLALGAGSAALAGAGCGDDDPYIAPPRPDARPQADAATWDAAVADAMPLPDVMFDPGGPRNVQVTRPAADEAVITERYTVTCSAEPSEMANPVTDVVFEVRDRTDNPPIVAAGTAVSTTVWEASVNLSSFANGALRVRCTATTSAAKSNSDDVTAVVDLGPGIDVVRPRPAEAVHAMIYVDFFVHERPTSADDPLAAVAEVKAFVAGQEVPLDPSPCTEHCTAAVRPDDPDVFPIPVEGPTVFRVEAASQRGGRRVFTSTLEVDNTPPTVTILAPGPASLVGGIMTVEATVSDAKGIDPESVVAVLGNGPIGPASTAIAEFPLVHMGEGKFVGVYDTRELRRVVETEYPGTMLVFPTLAVLALDLPGNVGAATETLVMDYMPPLISLDPPMVREARWSDTGALECSWLFDPLGDDASKDGQLVAQLSEFRARAQERANAASSTSGVPVFMAGLDFSSAQLFVLDTTDEASGRVGDALLVDTDYDGICDDVNPMLVKAPADPSTPRDVLMVNLMSIAPAGTAWWAPDQDCEVTPCEDPESEEICYHCEPMYESDYSGCVPAEMTHLPPEEIIPVPPSLCPSTGLQRVVPGIFGIPPVGGYTCVGLPVDSVANSIADSWACVATRIEDSLGNVGISRPLRVCIDHNDDGAEGCPGAPDYPGPPDVTSDRTALPEVPAANPPIDCTGTYFAAEGAVAESSDATRDCVMPEDLFDFMPGELVWP